MKFSKRTQLHCHSGFTPKRLPYMPLILDSYAKPKSILRVAAKNNIKILVITEHDHLESYPFMKNFIEESNLDILLIPGIEVSTKQGHVLGYGIKEHIPRGLSIKETLKRIHDQGGVAIAAHTYSPYGGVRKLIFENDFDALEVLEGLIPKYINKRTVLAAKKLNIPYTNSSDAHTALGIKKNTVYFPEDTDSIEKFLGYLKAGTFSLSKNGTPDSPPHPLIDTHPSQVL